MIADTYKRYWGKVESKEQRKQEIKAERWGGKEWEKGWSEREKGGERKRERENFYLESKVCGLQFKPGLEIYNLELDLDIQYQYVHGQLSSLQ